MGAYRRGKMYELNLAELMADPDQPRKTMDESAMAELVASIKKLGVLEPILFRVDGTGNKLVVAGERRVDAARQAGLSVISGIFTSGNHAEIALVENLLRQDLTPVEEAEGLQALMLQQQYTQEQLAEMIGKSQNYLSEILSLNRLPQEVRDSARGDRTIAKTVLIGVAKMKKAERMIAAYRSEKDKLGTVKMSGQKRNPNSSEKLRAQLEKSVALLAAADLSTWSEEEKNELHTLLARLRTELDRHLAMPPPT